MRLRVAFIDYFPTHYRRGLYEELARRLEADFYFFADERERYWNRRIPVSHDGRFSRGQAPPLAHRRTGGYAGGSAHPQPQPLRRRHQEPKRQVDATPDVWRSACASRALRPVDRHVGAPRDAGSPAEPAAHRGGVQKIRCDRRIRRACPAFPAWVSGVGPDKVFVAGQAVDQDRFADVQPSRNGDPPEILYIGQFEERKGLSYLLDAAASLMDVPLRVRLVGNGSQEREVRARAAELANVEVVGYRAQDDLPGELARSRCVVLPSITTALDKEPWGLVLNEAMLAGLPVVATDAVGAAAGGLVRDGQNGFVVPERNAGALAGAIRRLSTDKDLAARLGERARIDASAFTHSRMADAFEAAVEYAVANTAR